MTWRGWLIAPIGRGPRGMITQPKLSGKPGQAPCQGADLNGANLQGANLTGANLTATILQGAVLTSANLTGAMLTYAQLSQANLSETDFTGALGSPTAANNAMWFETTCPNGTITNSGCW